MGRCMKCNKDTGWGNGSNCGEHDFNYNDKVAIVSGFYKGQHGIVIDREYTGGGNEVEHTYYTILLKDGKEAIIDFFRLELLKKEPNGQTR